jgi:RNA methyltransferase, TrmH family
MPTKNEMKYYSSLLTKKFRKSENKFLVEGSKLIIEALNSELQCEIVLGLQSFFDENSDFSNELIRRKTRIEIVKSLELEKLSDTKNPQGVVAVFEQKSSSTKNYSPKLIVALENVSDPGNMGTIIRNCDWFGVKHIILSPGCAEIFNPKVIRSSAGSVFHLMIDETNVFYDDLLKLKSDSYKILCADLNGLSIYEYNQPEKIILVLANEANGPTQELLNIVDHTITIPGKGKAESLNVASASAVILSELTE